MPWRLWIQVPAIENLAARNYGNFASLDIVAGYAGVDQPTVSPRDAAEASLDPVVVYAADQSADSHGDANSASLGI